MPASTRTRSLIGASVATTDGGRSPRSWSRKRRRTGWRAPVSPPTESVAKRPNVASDAETQIRNERGTLSQTKQGGGVAAHHERAFGGGQLRLRERVDVASGGEQRVVRAEEQAVRTAEVGDRAVCAGREEIRTGRGVEPEPPAQLGHLGHVRVERQAAAEVRADQAQPGVA